MKFGTYLTGPFGQSQQLYQVRNEAKRGRASTGTVSAQVLHDTRIVIDKQKEAKLSFIVDPMFRFYYLFQALAENVRGVSAGPQENWFNNNAFYWRPRINGPLAQQIGFTAEFLHFDLLPQDGTAMAILPSPYTLLMLSDITGYNNRRSAIIDLALLLNEEAKDLVKRGIARIQYDEPAIVYKTSLGSIEKEDLELLRLAMERCGTVQGASTALHTYFGDSGSILSQLLDLPVDCIGIDMTETSVDDVLKHKINEKELALGLLDSRSTAKVDPKELVETLRKVADCLCPKALWITPNTGTEYRGWTYGMRALDTLSQVVGGLNE